MPCEVFLERYIMELFLEQFDAKYPPLRVERRKKNHFQSFRMTTGELYIIGL